MTKSHCLPIGHLHANVRTWRRDIEGVRARPLAAVPGAGVLQKGII